MFHGKLPMSHLLLDEGAASFTMARVQENVVRVMRDEEIRRANY